MQTGVPPAWHSELRATGQGEVDGTVQEFLEGVVSFKYQLFKSLLGTPGIDSAHIPFMVAEFGSSQD